MRLLGRLLVILGVLAAVFGGLSLYAKLVAGVLLWQAKAATVGKLKVGQVYETDERRTTPNYQTTDGNYVELVDDHRWLVIDRQLEDSWETTESYPSLSIITGTYWRVGDDYLFDRQYQIVSFAFSNQKNVTKRVYYRISGVTQHRFRSGNHMNLKKSGGIYLYGSAALYPAKGTLPDSIAAYMRTATYRPETSPYR